MPFASTTIPSSKTQEQIKNNLSARFDVSDYKDKLQLSVKREGGNRGFIRVLFPKIKTYLKVENGQVKCSMQMEWLGIIMLIAALGTLIAKYTMPEVGDESIPAWAPMAFIAWYLIYSFTSISKIKKAIQASILL